MNITLPVVGRGQLLDNVMDTKQPVVLVLHSLLKDKPQPMSLPKHDTERERKREKQRKGERKGDRKRGKDTKTEKKTK